MSTENVRILCPNLTCRRVLAVPTAARGKIVRCKNCGTNIKIPMAKSDVIIDPDKKKAG